MRASSPWLSSPTQRRLLLTTASGILIGAGFGAGWVTGSPTLRSGLLVAAAAIAGSDIALRALLGLRRRQVTIELLVTIAATGAVAIGEAWEAAAVTFLFMLGAYLEARMLGRTRAALTHLLALVPATATVLRAGDEVVIAPDDVQVGETVLVRPGARIPVDGAVLRGRAAVDESMISGESLPVEKTVADPVYAGTISRDGVLWLRATGTGADTTLARIVGWVEAAQEAKMPMQRSIERFARWYTPAIIGLSVVLFLATRDTRLALTLLVIGCPGALVIATPVAVVAGIGRAAQRGILIKGGEHLEAATRISALALDKTGTITLGAPALTDLVVLAPLPPVDGQLATRTGSWSPAQQDVLRWAAIAEAGSEHPLALPILDAARTVGAVRQADEIAVHAGRGVSATYQGHAIAVGTRTLMGELGVAISVEAEERIRHLTETGTISVLLAHDGRAAGIFGLADTRRAAAAAMVAGLKAGGLRRIALLTGDGSRTAEAIAREVGIDEVYAGLLPVDKLAHIRRLQQAGHVVAMVGDGINDAPALAAADVGIAMGARGTALTVETADIVLMTDDLMKLPEALRLARATTRAIRQNLVIALATAAALLVGVLFGRVGMAGGMFVHQASVLLVVVNALRLLRA